jgi:hypothetical protein
MVARAEGLKGLSKFVAEETRVANDSDNENNNGMILVPGC